MVAAAAVARGKLEGGGRRASVGRAGRRFGGGGEGADEEGGGDWGRVFPPSVAQFR